MTEAQYDIVEKFHALYSGGRIQFHGDCHHALAGQTVDLPDWDS